MYFDVLHIYLHKHFIFELSICKHKQQKNGTEKMKKEGFMTAFIYLVFFFWSPQSILVDVRPPIKNEALEMKLERERERSSEVDIWTSNGTFTNTIHKMEIHDHVELIWQFDIESIALINRLHLPHAVQMPLNAILAWCDGWHSFLVSPCRPQMQFIGMSFWFEIILMSHSCKTIHKETRWKKNCNHIYIRVLYNIFHFSLLPAMMVSIQFVFLSAILRYSLIFY